jgi:hypothetical protein
VVLPPEPDCAGDPEDALDAQLSRGATLALTPAHEHEGGPAREHQVRLARATIAAWEARQGWRPPPQRPETGPRELYATLVVGGRDVEDATGWLIEAYAPLAVNGYWLEVPDAVSSTRHAAAVARLALGLQRYSGRPVVAAGGGDIHLALLASGVAAVCSTGESEAIFHPAILSSLPLGPRSAPVGRRLFLQRPCACGAHPPSEPPAGRAAILAHNRHHAQQEALEAASMAPAIAEHRLLARAGRASTLRRELRLTPLATGWQGVADAARDVRGAPGAAGEMTG